MWQVKLLKPVPGWPGWFAMADGSLRTPKGERILGWPSKSGHLCFQAKKKCWQRKFTQWIHRFVALAFVENPRPDIFREVDHIDRNPANNVPGNLRWLNRSLNSLNNGAANASYHKRFGKWFASVSINGRRRGLGYYKTKEEASAIAHAFKRGEFKRIYDEFVNEQGWGNEEKEDS